MTRYARDQPCPCGSGRIFRKCHGRVGGPKTTTPRALPEPSSLYSRNVAVLDALQDIFKHRTRPWDEIRRTLCGDQVKEVYRVVLSLWPRDTDLPALLPEPSSNLRAVYLGDPNPDALARSVFRFSLYSDEIILFNPFFANLFRAPEVHPYRDPDQHRADMLKLLYSMIMLDPWIRGGIVHLVPEPGYFDRAFDARALKSAAARIDGLLFSEDENEEMAAPAKDDIFRWMKRLPPQLQEQWAREFDPTMSEEDVRATVKWMAKETKEDPLALDQPVEPRAKQLHIVRQGTNLESALHICELTGAFPFTNLRSVWRQIGAAAPISEATRDWTSLAQAFESLRFRFLNEVDTSFAYRMRSEERLLSLRTFLRKLWNTVDKQGLNTPRAAIEQFEGELREEYGKAEAEWKDIDRDLAKGFASSAATPAALAAIFGGLTPLFAAGLTIAAMANLWVTSGKRLTFRRKTPMAVMLELARFSPKDSI